VVSLLVMGLTGYAWASFQGLVNGLNYADVIDPKSGGDQPADGARDILLVGLDSRTDAQGNPLSQELLDQLKAGESDGELNTDSLIFVHIPNNGSKAVAFSLPRDSYVDIPGGYGKHKINSAYARAMLQARKDLQKQGITDPKELDVKANQAGAKELISTVEALTGFTIDNYAAINLLGFSDITQAIGGVDVCLSDNVDDSYSGAKFTKGLHTISGVQALEFVRQRHGLPRGDLDRVVRQQVFMAGMARKVLSAGTLTDPSKLNALIDAIKKSVVLNQNWDIFGFAEQMKGLTGGQLEFRTIPVENVDYQTPSDGSAIKVDPAQVKAFVQGVAGPPGQQQAAPPADSANKATTVDVRNSSGRTGLAASVSKQLAGKGFTAGDTANGTSRKTTVIWVPKGGNDAGQAVADALGTKATVQEDKSVSAGHVMIFLGTDYSPSDSASGGSNAAGAPASSSAPAVPAAPDDGSADKPITADGVPCVN
jgi:LCP family protein required for cell wall assembly